MKINDKCHVLISQLKTKLKVFNYFYLGCKSYTSQVTLLNLRDNFVNWLKNYFFSPYISWRFVEWLIILGDLFSVLLSDKPFLFVLRPYLLWIQIGCTLIFLLLSFVFPINQPIWQRKVYIAVEIGFVCIALMFGIHFDILMYFIWAKACFLLKRRDAIIMIVATGIAYIIIEAWTLPQLLAEREAYLKSITIEELIDLTDTTPGIVLDTLIELTIIAFFLTLFMFLLVKESKSRKKAEKLAKEVEILATTLERNRIARDIHDSLGHTLTTLGVQLELAQKLHGVNSERATQALHNAQQLASQSLIEVRNTVSAIREEKFDLERALNNLVNQLQRDNVFGIQMKLNLPAIPLQTSHQIYCIVKEALYNVQKHSQADLVTINSQTTSQNIILEITDNGIGFDPHKIDSGSGLRGMLERSQIINGQLKIDTAPDRGTIIQLIVPINN
ncbi:MAG: sensor histidine kinase [Xenococcaceae cyanobacterium MO_188.B32]|nr:sensor histidine kinase [Xenococcaceae cyanobacterium MO_188.B32]